MPLGRRPIRAAHRLSPRRTDRGLWLAVYLILSITKFQIQPQPRAVSIGSVPSTVRVKHNSRQLPDLSLRNGVGSGIVGDCSRQDTLLTLATGMLASRPPKTRGLPRHDLAAHCSAATQAARESRGGSDRIAIRTLVDGLDASLMRKLGASRREFIDTIGNVPILQRLRGRLRRDRASFGMRGRIQSESLAAVVQIRILQKRWKSDNIRLSFEIHPKNPGSL
jgi:hypothetical protein